MADDLVGHDADGVLHPLIDSVRNPALLSCAGLGHVGADDVMLYKACRATVAGYRALVFPGWCCVLWFCPAHAALFDSDTTDAPRGQIP